MATEATEAMATVVATEATEATATAVASEATEATATAVATEATEAMATVVAMEAMAAMATAVAMEAMEAMASEAMEATAVVTEAMVATDTAVAMEVMALDMDMGVMGKSILITQHSIGMTKKQIEFQELRLLYNYVNITTYCHLTRPMLLWGKSMRSEVVAL